jgi:carbamate kinase
LARTIVVALGGNAIKGAEERGTAEEQFRNVRETCKHILEIITRGYKVVITHRNVGSLGTSMRHRVHSRRFLGRTS